VRLQPVDRVVVERLARQSVGGGPLQEMTREHGDIAAALAERGQHDGDDVEPVEQVLAELPRRDRLLEIAIGRRDDPHVGLDRPRAADRREFALLEDAEQPGLRLHRHVADLVEEQGAARRLLEPAGAARLRAGERAALVPEQLRLDQLARDRRHVDRDERRRPPPAELVDRARDQLLASPRLARDQHRQIVRDHPRDDAIDLLHRRRAPDQRQLRIVVDHRQDAGLAPT
jgi:hypothetical protein